MKSNIYLIVLMMAILISCSESADNKLDVDISQTYLEVLNKQVKTEFAKLRPQSIRPAEGYIKYDYLIPAGFYKQMWDWDGFFIGAHLTSINKPEYLKYWVLNFAQMADSVGYVPGCITSKGPRPLFGKFAMKPFIAQGAYIASDKMNDFSWITNEVYQQIASILSYREKISLDTTYGLFYWDDAMSSGGDNNVVLTNDKNLPGEFLAVDLNAFMYREYKAMSRIAKNTGNKPDAHYYQQKANNLKTSILTYLWDDEAKSFWNMFRRTGRLYRRVSYSNFIPLMTTDIIDQANGKLMINKYLWNREHMLSNYGLRTLSIQDPDYNNDNIIVPYSNWQGPVWPVANYMYFVALKNYGFNNECKQLASVIGSIVLEDINSCGSMHENYNADNGAPLAPTAAQSSGGVFTGFVGWNLLVQNMLMGAADNDYLLLKID